jgi:DNA-directed RNA polymerase subunit N (RpoN/RPB10)
MSATRTQPETRILRAVRKRCSACERTLPATVENFGENRSRRDGLGAYCRSCAKALHKDWRDRNREHVRDEHRRAVAADPERHRRYAREWARRLPPDERRAIHANERARRYGVGGTLTAVDIGAQRERQRGRCYWCGAKIGEDYHIDHVVPFALGGTNYPTNVVITCPSCNCHKSAKHPMEWAGRLL